MKNKSVLLVILLVIAPLCASPALAGSHPGYCTDAEAGLWGCWDIFDGTQPYCQCFGYGNPKDNPYEQVIPEPGGGGGSECVTYSTAQYNAVRNCIEDCPTCTFGGCCSSVPGTTFIP